MVSCFTYIVPYLVGRVVIRGIVSRGINVSLSMALFSQEDDKKAKEAQTGYSCNDCHGNQSRVVIFTVLVTLSWRIFKIQMISYLIHTSQIHSNANWKQQKLVKSHPYASPLYKTTLNYASIFPSYTVLYCCFSINQ